jgi:deazaflavin-dependent oxidoreductase (nitroreductase family)
MRTVDRIVGIRLLHLHQRIYELTGGRVGHRLGGARTLLLRTRGRRTGRERTAALLYRQDGSRLVVVGSKGGSDEPPGWLVNLRAHPDVEVQIGTRRFPARARLAAPEERERLWPVMVAAWPAYARYQAQTRRTIPLVILEPAAG